MNLLDSKTWTGRVFIDGWRVGGGGERAVTEPATGEILGRAGIAASSDIGTAAARAAEAQQAWASTAYDTRARVLSSDGDLCRRAAEEIQGWLVREGGAIPPFGLFQTEFAQNACYEAAGLASLPYGEMLRTKHPHVSFSRRNPVGVVG